LDQNLVSLECFSHTTEDGTFASFYIYLWASIYLTKQAGIV
jgi:hypothetical protein